MPISDIQADILRQIAAHRHPDNYLAGATVLHRRADSPRYSHDLDFFHDVADCVAASAEQDAAKLQEAGYAITWLLRTPAFYRATATTGQDRLKIEWAQDSAFRFFPVQQDEQCGYRLHETDAAINKILALAGRSEVRDFVDAIHLHNTYLSLGAMVWAACGKDPGYTPDFLLDQAGRHTAYTQVDVDRLSLRHPLDLRAMKQQWCRAQEEARALTASLPPEELGCLYLDPDLNPVTPDPQAAGFARLTRHGGTLRGAWPTVSPG
jgi:hypothetical protein